jgi:hypothetical protein
MLPSGNLSATAFARDYQSIGRYRFPISDQMENFMHLERFRSYWVFYVSQGIQLGKIGEVWLTDRQEVK